MKTPQKFRAEINRNKDKKQRHDFKVGDTLSLRFSEHHYIWHYYTLDKDGWFVKDKD